MNIHLCTYNFWFVPRDHFGCNQKNVACYIAEKKQKVQSISMAYISLILYISCSWDPGVHNIQCKSQMKTVVSVVVITVYFTHLEVGLATLYTLTCFTSRLLWWKISTTLNNLFQTGVSKMASCFRKCWTEKILRSV